MVKNQHVFQHVIRVGTGVCPGVGCGFPLTVGIHKTNFGTQMFMSLGTMLGLGGGFILYNVHIIWGRFPI